MPSVRTSSIASSCQVSPHAEVLSAPQEPLNPEIMVLPVVPSSPVASSSPAATDPVAEPDELEGDKETPLVKEAKVKKGGKPSSPLPAPGSPINEAQPVPSGGSPKLTSPAMPASNVLSKYQLSASPLYPVQQQQQNNFAITNACQEMDFPETSYICQLHSAVMHWFWDSKFPESRLPSNVIKISMGPYLEDFDLALLNKSPVPNYRNACQTARIKSYHAEDIISPYP
ncbi:hypothetical protein C8J56DRAFT_880153 [Mycena floridula]|nr:hypothetical protein C8J56DRAFT_880153 [Mycena floridula]